MERPARLHCYTHPKAFSGGQLIIPNDKGIPSAVAFFDNQGNQISDASTLDYLVQLAPEFQGFNLLTKDANSTIISSAPAAGTNRIEEIVEVRGSSECFEYQFPASPEFFFGRRDAMQNLEAFVMKLHQKEISSRGILIEANSGWGKSSVVLAAVDKLNKSGHFAVAIDSRSAASPQFILRVVEHVFARFGDFGGICSLPSSSISGFDGAAKSLISLGQAITQQNKMLFIFLDQFENIFQLPEALRRIVELLLRLCDSQVNVIMGFAWKADLIGSTSQFPYQLRDSIVSSSCVIPLGKFSEVETTALLDRLRTEIKAPLRKDLKFFLSEFSQGYPWLLKKLCAHVKAQREAGVPQVEIASSLLNVEGLFREDLRGLSSEEEDVIRGIAKVAPINVVDLGDEFRPEVARSLVDRRLVVRIGNKYDIYWDIFRDYLTSGKVPVQENYLLRVQIGSVIKSMKILTESQGKSNVKSFRAASGLSTGSFYNVARDMRLLGLADFSEATISALVSLPKEQPAFESALRIHLRERLKRNRLVWYLLQELESRLTLNLGEMAKGLLSACPYITATEETWQTYARFFADWMDFSDLAIFDSRSGILSRYELGTQVRDRGLYKSRNRGVAVPIIQYSPIEEIAVRLVQAIQSQGGTVDWSNLSRSSVSKALMSLETLGFISRRSKSIIVNSVTRRFAAADVDQRAAIFGEAALENEPFAKFIKILGVHAEKGESLSVLSEELKEALGANWKLSTAQVYVKVMLDGARHANLAPGIFAKSQRGRHRSAESNGDLFNLKEQ